MLLQLLDVLRLELITRHLATELTECIEAELDVASGACAMVAVEVPAVCQVRLAQPADSWAAADEPIEIEPLLIGCQALW